MQPSLIKALIAVLVLLAMLPALRRYVRLDPGGFVWSLVMVGSALAAFGLILKLMLPFASETASDGQRLAAASVMLGALAGMPALLTQLLPDMLKRPRHRSTTTLNALGLAAATLMLVGFVALLRGV